MHNVPVKNHSYYKLDKSNNSTCHLGSIADVKNYIMLEGTKKLSMNFRIETKTEIKVEYGDYDSVSNRYITTEIPITRIIRPYVIFDDEYRIFNYTNLKYLTILQPKQKKEKHWRRICGKMCWVYGSSSTGYKRRLYHRGKNHHNTIVPIREKRLTEAANIDFDEINIMLDEENIETNSVVIDKALRHSRIRNRWINSYDNHKEPAYGTPKSWKKQHKRKQWQKKHEVTCFDKHTHIYEINSEFIKYA